MPVEYEVLRTDDMSMVTTLKVKGHQHKELSWENSVCFWIVDMTPEVSEVVQDFINGRALVEPRMFSREFARTKREFYDAQRDRNLSVPQR